MTSTAEDTLNDMAFVEVRAIEKLMEKTTQEMENAYTTIKRMETRIDNLDDKYREQNRDLKKAKRQASDLKKFVWSSDNPNIIELRGELLLTAKLIQDNTTTTKK